MQAYSFTAYLLCQQSTISQPFLGGFSSFFDYIPSANTLAFNIITWTTFIAQRFMEIYPIEHFQSIDCTSFNIGVLNVFAANELSDFVSSASFLPLLCLHLQNSHPYQDISKTSTLYTVHIYYVLLIMNWCNVLWIGAVYCLHNIKKGANSDTRYFTLFSKMEPFSATMTVVIGTIIILCYQALSLVCHTSWAFVIWFALRSRWTDNFIVFVPVDSRYPSITQQLSISLFSDNSSVFGVFCCCIHQKHNNYHWV